jgi:uncharacterized BrkB/YihY/UPF0761 family membrane protein
MEQPPQSTDLFDLHIDQQVSSYLGETAKWAKFLAILGFIMCGLAVIVALFGGAFIAAIFNRVGTSESGVFGAFVSVIYIGIALLYFFPCLYLFNFARKMQAALRNNDQQNLANSFRNLKACYRFVGILMIILLSFYAIALIIGIIGAAVSR